MTIKLARQEISIMMADKSHKQIAAWVYEDRLACHKDSVLKVWVIDHVPTGYQVTTFNGHYRLIRPLLEKVDTLLDWSIDDIYAITRLLYNFDDPKHEEIRSIIQDFELTK